jgi:hypothetical protein
MPSHSAAETVDDAPADSAVSVVGTGVWLGARPDAIFAMDLRVSWGCGVKWAQVAMFQGRCSWRVVNIASTRLAPAPGIGATLARSLPQIAEARICCASGTFTCDVPLHSSHR